MHDRAVQLGLQLVVLRLLPHGHIEIVACGNCWSSTIVPVCADSVSIRLTARLPRRVALGSTSGGGASSPRGGRRRVSRGNVVFGFGGEFAFNDIHGTTLMNVSSTPAVNVTRAAPALAFASRSRTKRRVTERISRVRRGRVQV